MIQKHRIRTDVGVDKVVTVDIQQKFDLLEILSLKFSQQDVYTSLCADYGVVCGRISVNNGYGVPNARVSIFIPLAEEDVDDPVVSVLYPYKSVGDKNEDGYRYNLLPLRKQHGGHQPTGTFPDQRDILTREEVLEVYEKYYKYTVKTNDSGDFMIWGVPLGQQTIHVDVDLSDIGCFSLRPDDFIRNGFGLDKFKSTYEYKSSVDIDSLPQVISFDRTIEVYPFWGNADLCTLGITRTDFDLSDQGVKIQPKAYLIGGFFSDTNKNALNKNCAPRSKMGRKCDMISPSAKIESIRFTTRRDSNYRPILEHLDTQEDVDDTGSFVMSLEMNMDYVYTNEFGENEYTNDSNKGIPTSGVYRMRASVKNETLGRTRVTASYLLPNIKEYTGSFGEIDDKSYAWSTNLDDYPSAAITGITKNVDGFYYPEDYFYRFTYNKVYTVSSFQSSYFKDTAFSKNNFLGIKEIVPAEEEDCAQNVTTFPVNFGIKNYTFTLLIADVLLFIEHLINLVTLTFFNTISRVFHSLADAVDFWPIRKLSKIIKTFAYQLQDSSQRELYLITYPDCVECNGENSYGSQGGLFETNDYCIVGTIEIVGSSDQGNRILTAQSPTFSVVDEGECLANATPIVDMADFISRQSDYIITYNSIGVSLTSTSFSGATGTTYNDTDGNFADDSTYTVYIRDKNATAHPIVPLTPLEEGCTLYDIPYDESIVTKYYTGDTPTRVGFTTYTKGMNVTATRLNDTTDYKLVATYYGQTFTRKTPGNGDSDPDAGYSEFANGIFYIVPGSQSNGRLWSILKEYRRRKRVAKMFCGGIVNYTFIDNWLSGSLYFFAFKAKNKRNNNAKYCTDVVRWVSSQETFYYRSCRYNPTLNQWGTSYSGSTYSTSYKRINRPTTFVDLGPRDEFIKEICTDPNLDPNCSVVRKIGPTSFKSFGELLGLAINYRLDVSDNNTDIDKFFDNGGFDALGVKRVLDGDILQLISINNEVGIEEFDLQNPNYLGYSYQILDPDIYPAVFTGGTNTYGPLPVTFYLSEDGQRQRLCLNEATHTNYYGDPVQGRLTESAQVVPFFLWEKGGTGFGPYNAVTLDDQHWDYVNIQTQPLQGMTYGYSISGTPNDSSDKYLLLPMTYNFDGLAVPNLNVTNDVDFDTIETSDNHTGYDSQYPGYMYLYVSSGTTTNPLAGTLYTRYGDAGTWHSQSWDNTKDFIIRKTQDYYSGTKQILSTPFLFYFGLRPDKNGINKFIERFGPSGAFPSAE